MDQGRSVLVVTVANVVDVGVEVTATPDEALASDPAPEPPFS